MEAEFFASSIHDGFEVGRLCVSMFLEKVSKELEDVAAISSETAASAKVLFVPTRAGTSPGASRNSGATAVLQLP